jgi:hypothetical protein
MGTVVVDCLSLKLVGSVPSGSLLISRYDMKVGDNVPGGAISAGNANPVEMVDFRQVVNHRCW